MSWDALGGVAGLLAVLLAVPGFLIGLRQMRAQIARLEEQAEKGNTADAILNKIRKIASDEKESFWTQDIDRRVLPKLDRSIPILMLGNLKGGVGKSTIAANLAAAFAHSGERVLALDLDYQGSLSGLMLGHSSFSDPDVAKEVQERGSALIKGEHDPDYILAAARAVPDFPNLYYLATSYDLARVEDRLMLKWLTDPEMPDIRLALGRLLHSEQIQNRFDRIIIDTAPRVTTAFINGFCTATHLLVPTILDEMSIKSVENFLEQLQPMKTTLNPGLQVIGVVANKAKIQRDSLIQREQEAMGRLREACRYFADREDFVIDDNVITYRRQIAEASGDALAYHSDVDGQQMFDELARIVGARAPSLRRP